MTRAVLAAFLAGGGVMALEILASRWMAPGLGFTLTTWAWLISATLLGGAVGAALGGRLGRQATWRRCGALLACAGLWTIALAFGAAPLVDALDGVSVTLGAAIAAVLLVGPPVLLLGAVLPVATALARAEEDVAPTVGRLVAASTVGSLVGTLLAAFVIVPSLGLHPGALLVAGLLVAGGLFVSRRSGGALLILALGVAATATSSPRTAGAELERQTPYGLLTLAAAPAGGWTLAIDGIAQARVSPMVSGPGSLLAKRQYVELLPHLRPLGTRALQIGLGGGLVPTTLAAYGIEVQSLEVNPGIVDVLRSRFGFEGVVHVGDGRALWRRMDERFDFVVLDAFQGESLPAHLVTREAFTELAARLEPGGVICIHLIGTPNHEAVGAVAATLDAVFAHTLAVRSGVGDELQDLFLFGSDRPLTVPPSRELAQAGWLGNETFVPGTVGAPVLTDDRNPIEVLNRPLAQALRGASRVGSAGKPP